MVLRSLDYALFGVPLLTWCNPTFHIRTQQIEINFHFTQDKVDLLDIRIILTKDQIADIWL